LLRPFCVIQIEQEVTVETGRMFIIF